MATKKDNESQELVVAEPTKPRGRRGASSPRAIETAARERQTIELRTAGYTFEEIAQQVGYKDRSAAKKAVERGLGRWMRETDQELRAVMLERCETVVRRIWPQIDCDYPDPDAIAAFHKITDLEAKLSGAYASTRQQVDVKVHGRVEHTKLDALAILEADVELAEIVDEHLAGEAS